MTNLEQLHLFLKFHFAPWGAAKGEIWEEVSRDAEYSDINIFTMCEGILSGRVKLTDYDIQMLRIVAEPTSLVAGQTDEQWAERISACNSGDTEADHADADRLLVNLVAELGYQKSAAAWQSIGKWYA